MMYEGTEVTASTTTLYNQSMMTLKDYARAANDALVDLEVEPTAEAIAMLAQVGQRDFATAMNKAAQQDNRDAMNKVADGLDKIGEAIHRLVAGGIEVH